MLLVRVPKSLALLEDQLHRLAPARAAGHRRRRHRHGQGDPHLDPQALRADPRARPEDLAGREEGPPHLHHPGPGARQARRQPVAADVLPAQPASAPPPGSRSSITPGSSAPNASTSAPASCSSTCPSARARTTWWTWAAATASWHGGGARQPRGARSPSPTSRSRRWPRPRPRSGCARGPRARPTSGSATASRARAGHGRPGPEQPAVPHPPGDDGPHPRADVRRTPARRCVTAASCGSSATGTWATT